ncbi:MAG: DNA polymerase III subunit gamma/tau [Acutalibacteraceae bacterium]
MTMYRVLYRKYRPQFFADVVGQPQVTQTLKNELKAGRISHAYLFTGSRGTGKTTCSKILAKAINCLNPHDGDPCGECEICRGIDDGSIMDVVEIDAASNNGVDDIRLLREEANFTPANTKYRVYIIDEVHMLSMGAFNALLKTLEEPPPHVVFILATTEVHKLPATIMSRCQRFDFHRISPQDIASRLDYVCKNEGVEIESQAALLIAGIADGALRDALSLLDQCMGQSAHITEDIVRKTAGLADKSHLISITDAVISHDSSKAIEIIDELHKSSKDMARLCEELTEHFREIMLIKTMKKPADILVMSESEFAKISEQAKSITLSDAVSAIDILQDSLEKMLKGANRRIEMEMTVVKLCTPAIQSDTQSLEKRIAVLENTLNAIKTQPLMFSQPSAKPETTNRTSAPIKRPSAEEMEQLRKDAVPMTQWADVIEDIKKYSRTVGAGFEGSTAYISGKYVLVDSPNDICFELLRKPAQRDKMRDSIKRITGKEYKLGRYSYPDETKTDDPLSQLVSDFKSAGIPVEDKNNK